MRCCLYSAHLTFGLRFLTIIRSGLQDMKRKAVEQKLEEKQKEEKEKLKTEKQQLFIDRKEKLMQMKQLENKIELVKLVSIQCFSVSSSFS